MAPAATPTTSTAPAASRWSRPQLIGLVAITLLAAALRRFRIEQWSWSDSEAANWRAVTAPMREVWSGSDALAPLGWLGLRALSGVGLLPGFGEGWMRLPFAIAGIAAVPLLASVVRARCGAGAALLAALLLALHPLALAASQAVEPVVLAVVGGLVGTVAAQAGARRVAWIAFVLAGLCAPIGWTFAGVELLRPHARRVVPVAAAAALLLMPFTLAHLGLPLLVAAALGLLTMGAMAERLPAVLSLAVASLAVLLWPTTSPASLLVAVPELTVAAAGGLVRFAAAARPHLQGSPRAIACGGATAAAVVVAWLAVDAFLYSTVFRGQRTPWRLAADAVLVASNEAPGFVVGAAAGAPVLTCYLRPRHWRGDEAEPHPGKTVVALDAAQAPAALAALSPPKGVRVLLVLRSDELQALPDAARDTLARDFELLRVIESPQPHGNATLYVHRRVQAN